MVLGSTRHQHLASMTATTSEQGGGALSRPPFLCSSRENTGDPLDYPIVIWYTILPTFQFHLVIPGGKMNHKKWETTRERDKRLMEELNLFMFAVTLATAVFAYYEGGQPTWAFLTLLLLLVAIFELLVGFIAATVQYPANGWVVIWFSQMGIQLLVVLTLLIATGEIYMLTLSISVGGTWLSLYLYYYRTWNS